MPTEPEAHRDNDPDAVERPEPGQPGGASYGSDCVADVLRALGIPFVALNPGASFRGLHDSLVNHLGNRDPRMLLCLHEEHAVAIARGWAKITGQPMAAALHSNVGLMHGAMAQPARSGGALTVAGLAAGLRDVVAGQPTCLIRSPLSWSGAFWPVNDPLGMLGYDGGGGIGSGPGMIVGAALALRGTGRLPVAVIGDGDFLMGCTAFWTAARYGIPLLALIANNQSFFNDEVHQERVGNMRGRNPANKWIGQYIGEPDIDLAAIARAQGCAGWGPVHDPSGLQAALAQALEAVHAGQPAVVDVRAAQVTGPI